jgi:transposase
MNDPHEGPMPGEHQHQPQNPEAQQTLAFGATSCSGSAEAAPCAASQPIAEQAITQQPIAHPAIETAQQQAAPVVSQVPAPTVETVAVTVTAVATEVATEVAPVATITESTAKDFVAALKTAHRARAAQAQASASRPKESDLVARRIVLRRDRWEALLGLASALQSQRGVAASPAEVAAIVLDAGLNVILEESRAATAEAKQAAKPAARRGPGRPAGSHGRKARARRAKPVRNRNRNRSAAAANVSKLRAPRPLASRPKPRNFTAGELGSIRGLVRSLKSQRSVQRTLALWLGGQGKGNGHEVQVPVEDLRALCREFKVYDTANFAQNMKKDSAWFVEVRDRDGERLGYGLTSKGAAAAADLLAVHAKR